MRALTDDAGAVVNEYSYDSYGRPETSVEALPQPFRFTGREYDPDTGLSHYRSRAFDPETGDLNVYRYVGNAHELLNVILATETAFPLPSRAGIPYKV